MTAGGRVRAALRREPLSSRSFRLLAAGQLASTIGDYCYAVALPWLVLSAHGGPVLLGAVLACYGVPRTVFIPVGGMLADRVGARTIMLVADAARCGLVAMLAVLAAGQVTSLALVGTLAAARRGQAARPVLVACGCFLAEAFAIAVIPFLGGLAGTAAATFAMGACNGLGNVIFLTLVQRWAPPRLLGRVMSAVMLAGLGSFPLSVAVPCSPGWLVA